MPMYTYRREDGTTFDLRQKFSDEPLSVDPATGQSVTRVVQAAGIIFKGSGFYVNDSKSKSSSTMTSKSNGKEAADSTTAKTDSASSETKSETKSEAKSDAKSEVKPSASTSSSTAAAD